MKALSMHCPSCNCRSPNFALPCGHRIHFSCLRKEKFCCPKCKKVVTTFNLFYTVLRNSGIEESERFYKKVSGCSDGFKGLIMWLIDNNSLDWIFRKIKDLSMHFFSFPKETLFEKLVLEASLMKGDLRLTKQSLRDYKAANIEIDDIVLEKLWRRGQIELLAEAYDLNFLSFNLERDPLLLAAVTGNIKLLERIIARGLNLSRISSNTCAILLACKTESFRSTDDQFRFLDLLLENGASLDYCRSNLNSECPFKKAVEDNNIELVEYLNRKGGKPEIDLKFLEMTKSSLEIAKFLHEAGIELSNKFFCLACEIGSFDTVSYIFEHGDKFKGDRDTINNLINQNNMEILELILRYGIQPCYENVKTACNKGNFDMVRLLIEYGADPRGKDQKSYMLLHDFNFESSIDDEGKLAEIIDFFLRIGADVDARDVEDNQTVLYKLCQKEKNLFLIKILIGFGANIHIATKNNKNTAFSLACFSGCPKIVRFLLLNGARLTEYNQLGMNCYLSAISSGNLETVKIALAFSDKNHVDFYTKGPFSYICRLISISISEKSALEIFGYLSEEGVKMNILDNHGQYSKLHSELLKTEHTSLLEQYFDREENRNFVLKYKGINTALYLSYKKWLRINYEDSQIEKARSEMEHASINNQ